MPPAPAPAPAPAPTPAPAPAPEPARSPPLPAAVCPAAPDAAASPPLPAAGPAGFESFPHAHTTHSVAIATQLEANRMLSAYCTRTGVPSEEGNTARASEISLHGRHETF